MKLLNFFQLIVVRTRCGNRHCGVLTAGSCVPLGRMTLAYYLCFLDISRPAFTVFELLAVFHFENNGPQADKDSTWRYLAELLPLFNRQAQGGFLCPVVPVCLLTLAIFFYGFVVFWYFDRKCLRSLEGVSNRK
jgi:hypothetical protein